MIVAMEIVESTRKLKMTDIEQSKIDLFEKLEAL